MPGLDRVASSRLHGVFGKKQAMEWKTTSTILAALQDFENRNAWGGFVERFQPIIVGHARNLGFQAADAEDVAQTALMRFAAAYRDGGYDRAKGSLRNWMFVITNRVMVDHYRSGARKKALSTSALSGDVATLDIEDPAAARDFDEVWNREMLAKCLEKAKMEFSYASYRAFVLLALHERPAGEIAEELGMTRRAVYLAKYRVLKRMTELQTQFEDFD